MQRSFEAEFQARIEAWCGRSAAKKLPLPGSHSMIFFPLPNLQEEFRGEEHFIMAEEQNAGNNLAEPEPPYDRHLTFLSQVWSVNNQTDLLLAMTEPKPSSVAELFLVRKEIDDRETPMENSEKLSVVKKLLTLCFGADSRPSIFSLFVAMDYAMPLMSQLQGEESLTPASEFDCSEFCPIITGTISGLMLGMAALVMSVPYEQNPAEHLPLVEGVVEMYAGAYGIFDDVALLVRAKVTQLMFGVPAERVFVVGDEPLRPLQIMQLFFGRIRLRNVIESIDTPEALREVVALALATSIWNVFSSPKERLFTADGFELGLFSAAEALLNIKKGFPLVMVRVADLMSGDQRLLVDGKMLTRVELLEMAKSTQQQENGAQVSPPAPRATLLTPIPWVRAASVAALAGAVAVTFVLARIRKNS
jgi:hypothetical protein